MQSLAELPVRSLLSVPLASVVLFAVAGSELTTDPVLWAIWTIAIAGGWLLTLLVNFAIGILALFVESSTKVMDVWLALFFVFSGYMVPIELFPPLLRDVIEWTPFRYQLGVPVEIMTNLHTRDEAIALVVRQWGMLVVAAGVVTLMWRRGLRHFAAYGG
jgi:ABC-2 type transport system permease protein